MAFRIVYLPTGRTIGTVEAKSERGAKAKWTRTKGYTNWDLHAAVSDAQ